MLACVGKLIAFRQKRARTFRQRRARTARRRGQTETFVEPFLWIIAAGRPTAALAGLGCRPDPRWPNGVYLGPRLLCVGIVVASELPRNRETLLVRLMAAGPLLPQVLDELAELPKNAHERAVADQILLDLQHVLGRKASPTLQEQEFIVRMYKTWDDVRDEGRAEEAANAVLTALRVRGIAVSATARKRILAQKDPERLRRWHERAIVASSVSEVLKDPN